MATQSQEFKAKSVDDAITEGLTVLGVSRDAVEIEIINKGSRGIFGIGSEPAVVRLTLRVASSTTETPLSDDEIAIAEDQQEALSDDIPKDTGETTSVVATDVSGDEEADSAVDEPGTPFARDDSEDDDESEENDDAEESDDNEFEGLSAGEDDDDLAAMAADILDEMIHLMGFEADVTASWFEEDDDFDDEDDQETEMSHRRRYLRLDVEGTDLGALIGRRGETLENIQYLLRLMVNQKIHQWKNIIVDVEHYKERRVKQLSQLAERMADQVARSGRAISLEPMPANERRIVHMVLRNHPDVYTESYGDGPRRKVHIFARD